MLKKILDTSHKIKRIDHRIPLILLGVVVSVSLTTFLDLFGSADLMSWTHNKVVHFTSNELIMWFFFCFLASEIRLKQIAEGGIISFSQILGGILMPPIAVFLLTDNLAIAWGAMATDVAFSLGALKLAKGGRAILALVSSSLLILAIGDDMLGVGVLGLAYSKEIFITPLLAMGIIVTLSWVIGSLEEALRNQTYKRNHKVLFSPYSWMLLATVSTYMLSQTGFEWLLGGCVILLAAPQSIKDFVHNKLGIIMPILLLFFGVVNGAISLLPSSGNWGWITAATFIGGFGGKQAFIFLFGLLGKAINKKFYPESDYNQVTCKELFMVAQFASVNGTVAIFFVIMGRDSGLISPELASQAILGYFLTIPAVYIQTWLLKKVNFYS